MRWGARASCSSRSCAASRSVSAAEEALTCCALAAASARRSLSSRSVCRRGGERGSEGTPREASSVKLHEPSVSLRLGFAVLHGSQVHLCRVSLLGSTRPAMRR